MFITNHKRFKTVPIHKLKYILSAIHSFFTRQRYRKLDNFLLKNIQQLKYMSKY